MGVAYSKEAQDHLEAAYDHLYIAKKIVYAKLFPEPENAHDNKAIAVSIKYNDDWCKVGHIAAELTKYLHAVWSDGLDFEVTVKHIKYRTSYLKVGFYITINLTKKGEGEPEVIRAAKKSSVNSFVTIILLRDAYIKVVVMEKMDSHSVQPVLSNTTKIVIVDMYIIKM